MNDQRPLASPRLYYHEDEMNAIDRLLDRLTVGDCFVIAILFPAAVIVCITIAIRLGY